MSVSAVTIRNFRNLASVDVVVPPAGVVIVGANGQGKTNFLEAVYYPVLFRSLRGARDRDLVRFGEAGFFIALESSERITAGYEVAGNRKKISIDGRPLSKLSDGIGHLAAVSFSPADRDLVSGGPSVRRRYLDVLLSLADPAYLRRLSTYRMATKHRNAALRQQDGRTAAAFDEPLARAGAAVANRRQSWVEKWANRYTELCTLLGETKGPIVEYRPRHWVPDVEGNNLRQELGRTLDRDLRRGLTSVGPHRDELALTLDGRALRSFGSAGQQRTGAMALRILEAETLTDETGVTPIALYDDVFVELDTTRQASLLHLIQESLPGQSIITAPRDSEVPPQLLDRPRWSMQGGVLDTE